jgi:UDP-N-acetyl-D-mannosaminuronic acid dehydrogenase
MRLVDRIRNGEATIAVVGLGRVGLPLAAALAHAGHRVVGIDANEQRNRAVAEGRMPFYEPACEAILARVVSSGRLTTKAVAAEVVPDSDVTIFCVGTPLTVNLRPNYDDLTAALSAVVPHLGDGQLLVMRSTVSPGTLVKVVLPFVERNAKADGTGVLVATCPERIAEGRGMEELRVLPEVIGAVDESSASAAKELFQRLGSDKVIHTTDPTSAELVKLFTNVYRYVNFALANEFALLGEFYGVDTHRIIDMVNEDYPRANVPKPGPAGGPCLSKDGYFLVEELTLPDFVLMASKLNDSVPTHAVRRLARRLAIAGRTLRGTRVAVLGQAFKRDSDDLRDSPAMRITEILEREGADVTTHDPFLPGGLDLEGALRDTAALILATNHSFYETLKPEHVSALMAPPRIALDCWGMLARDQFGRAGVEVHVFGYGEEL